jgi:adenine/guanine phosphoribosyltransferase-like PRPP-binding protein
MACSKCGVDVIAAVDTTALHCAAIVDRQLSAPDLTHREREILTCVRDLILREYRIGVPK